MKYVQTVLGRIRPEEMGFTLPHEHLFWDLSFYLPEDLRADDPTDPRNHPVTPELLGLVRYHLTDYRDNVVHQNLDNGVRELRWYKEAGGGTLCDCSAPGVGGDPVKVREASRRSGVHVIQCTGAYCGFTLPEELARLDREQMARRFIREIREGIGDTQIRCGFIKVGICEGFPALEQQTLAAAAMAQKETGAAILIHQPGLERRADQIFKILTDHGGDLNRTVMCHCDPLLPDHDYLDHMAKSGAYLSFDFFGPQIVLNLKGYKNLWLPSDQQRIQAIPEQIARGNLNRIVLSHDTVYKCNMRTYGGYGFAHLPRDILPLMRDEGYEEAWLRTMTVENPREIFSMKE